ncbi:DASH family cryptochrome [Shewanella olleyana]|nr:DASH family cryptochrome [Shewanella olleyana]
MSALIGQSREIAFAYIFDSSSFQPKDYQQRSLGHHRLAFINQSIADLREQLAMHGHVLHVCYGDPIKVICDLAFSNDIEAIGYSNSVGWYEQQIWRQCHQRLGHIKLISEWSDSLFCQTQIQGIADELGSFSQFRRRVEKSKLPVSEPRQTWLSSSHSPDSYDSSIDESPLSWSEDLPRPCHIVSEFFIEPSSLGTSTELPSIELSSTELPTTELSITANVINSERIKGGELSALQHINDYFSSTNPSTYKQTRNALDGFENSTKFSVFLANGNVSARQVWAAIKKYELQHGDNESTYWIGFELLWREYFHWLALQLGKRLFSFKGLAKCAPLTAFYPERFQKWCQGATPYPLVNACMKQLNATGYMSNRGRQIVASCLVNELGVDWRYGAAYFEQQLVDYDVASNWGNWQYIAGVGVDPRGGRHFNIEKQTQQYDPNGDFVARWCSPSNDCCLDKPLLDSVNIDDWPIDDALANKGTLDQRQSNSSELPNE